MKMDDSLHTARRQAEAIGGRGPRAAHQPRSAEGYGAAASSFTAGADGPGPVEPVGAGNPLLTRGEHTSPRDEPWAGPPDPTERTALLTRALRLYDAIDVMIGQALTASPAEQVRLAMRIVNRCGTLDDVLAAARVAPVRDRPTRAERSSTR